MAEDFFKIKGFFLEKIKEITMKEDTIAAIATAAGEGGIGIVRISGEKSFNILKKIFIPVAQSIKPRVLSLSLIHI